MSGNRGRENKESTDGQSEDDIEPKDRIDEFISKIALLNECSSRPKIPEKKAQIRENRCHSHQAKVRW